MNDPHTLGEPSLKLFIFNVGAGDNLLLELPNGEFGLIDFYYENSKDLRLGEPPSLTYLRDYLLRHKRKPVISFVCISHTDRDHIRGVEDFMDWVAAQGITVDQVITFSGWDFDEMSREIKRVRDERTPRPDTKAQADRVVKQFRALSELRGHLSRKRPEYIHDIRLVTRIEGGIEIVSLGPLGDHVRRFSDRSLSSFCRFLVFGDAPSNKRRNDVSAILKVTFMSHALMFTGDISEKILSECLDHYDQLNFTNEYGSLRAEFVKAPHHGAKSSSSSALWRRILRKRFFVGISAGRDLKHRPRYGHPHSKTLCDIAEGCRKLGRQRQVLSTNVCELCIQKQKRRWVNLEWTPEITLETGQQLQKDRAKYYRLRIPAVQTPGLAAHILNFNRDGTTNLQFGVSGQIGVCAECLYAKPAGRYFPECGLAR